MMGAPPSREASRVRISLQFSLLAGRLREEGLPLPLRWQEGLLVADWAKETVQRWVWGLLIPIASCFSDP